MGKINYQKIYNTNNDDWKALTREPQKYEALLAGHYSESNHFVYELLQNAEDEKADRVVIEYEKEKLVFYHNGRPFDENDVIGVSSMLMGNKDRNSAQTIGRFGMGFKSVFKYTYQPEIYSDEEAFRIENYLLPVEIEDGWDYITVKKNLCFPLDSGGRYYPFREQKHLTKIVIPFVKRSQAGNLEHISGAEVLQKLKELKGEILLFLSYIKKLYWIDRITGKYVLISLDEDQNDLNLLSCRIEGSALNNREELTRYLKFSKIFDHPEMKDAVVSVAYRVNNKANVINEMKGEPVWVYFPTRDMTDLPFLIHGSFETAVSREKLMTPSKFNAFLFQKLGDLIADSMEELKDRKLITQSFIRKVLMTSFKDEAENGTIPDLRRKLTDRFKEGCLLPDKEGNYRKASELSIPIPFNLAEFADSHLFEETFVDAGSFAAFNNERESNFTEYFVWMSDDIKIRQFTLADWTKKLHVLKGKYISEKGDDYKKLEEFYNFLSYNRESLYTTGLRYTRSGPYEMAIRSCLSNAWVNLKHAPVILNAKEELTAAYEGEREKLYLSATSDYQQMLLTSVVHGKITEKFSLLLKDGFGLTDFDNFQFVKEKVIKKYIKGDRINFDDAQDYEQEYIEDINQILLLFEKSHNLDEIREMLRKASIVKIVTADGNITFARPCDTYASKSIEGTDLRIYYETPLLEKRDNEEDDDTYIGFEDSGKYPIDETFYSRNGISVKKLYPFGIITSPVIEGCRQNSGRQGVESWCAQGEFCPELTLDYLDDNFSIIEYMPNTELSRRKSAELFKLVFAVREKLTGKITKRKTNPYTIDAESDLLKDLKSYYSWIYDKKGQLRQPKEISKFDLDDSLYGEVISDKSFYTMLGFKETEDDYTAEAFEQVDRLDSRNKKLLLRQLARELGMKVTDASEEEDATLFNDVDLQTKDVFEAESYTSEAFPVARVHNMDSLIEHVRQQFFCADPVTYRKVLRQIRTSKTVKADRAYVTGMYMNDSHVKICQMCRKPSTRVTATEIANFGIELPQLNLCLCHNCSAEYKAFREGKKEAFKEAIKVAICSLSFEENSEEYEIQLGADKSLYFTETHVAEIQTILGLLSEYGVPNAEQNEDELEKALARKIEDPKQDSRETASSMISDEIAATEEQKTAEMVKHDTIEISSQKAEDIKKETAPSEFDFLINSEPIQDGDLVSYKKMQTLEIVDAVIDSNKYPLHKAFLGKKVGDLVVANGRRYLIISIL